MLAHLLPHCLHLSLLISAVQKHVKELGCAESLIERVRRIGLLQVSDGGLEVAQEEQPVLKDKRLLWRVQDWQVVGVTPLL